jgi:hypothetical protein
MTKWAFVAHAAEWAIVDLSPQISPQTDFSPPSVQKHSFPPEQIWLGRTFLPHFDTSQRQFFSISHFRCCLLQIQQVVESPATSILDNPMSA